MKCVATATICALLAAPALAQEVGITPDMHSVTIEAHGNRVEIAREQDTSATIAGEFARIARACPDFCIQPMAPAEGVRTIGELEVLEALQDDSTVLVDGRVRPDWQTGTIPGAINMPFNEMADRLHELGCEPDFDGFICDLETIPDVVLFCNGPWCDQSPRAARAIIDAGYPVEKISYYRWGMQGWRMLGLTVAGGS